MNKPIRYQCFITNKRELHQKSLYLYNMHKCVPIAGIKMLKASQLFNINKAKKDCI